ncbi:LAQU0S10e03136g1_1 [Lachancea quebecensis]|uniref:RING-type E3 ubiquitin transferase n=1 Tax=Lachancea quebecensis TaxID=1654605 RepID=A0A0P1KUX7_9SACH|nr:LAQU0S10e03136g1_1 [Lachancea quebecensis]
MGAAVEESLGESEHSGALNASCRICRGESTSDSPLYHPCKCRGSIKYIHENCLLEWVASKNIDLTRPGANVKCDICHYSIQFKTLYDDNMPERIPVGLVIRTTLGSVFKETQAIIRIVVAITLLLVGIPLTWNTLGKLVAMLLFGGSLPIQGDFWKSLLYGFEANVPENPSKLSIALQLLKNYRFSLTQIVFLTVIHIALYFQYDMVVREPIFREMVYHNIGPRFNGEELATSLHNAMQFIRANEERMRARRADPLQEGLLRAQDLGLGNERAQARNDERDDVRDNYDHENLGREGGNLYNGEDDEDDDDYEPNEAAASEESVASEESSDHEIDEEERQQLDENNGIFNFPVNHRGDNGLDFMVQAAQQNVEREQHEERAFGPGRNDAAADNEEAWNQERAAIFGLQLRFRNLPFYFLAATAFLSIYLYLTYAIPTFLGNLLLTLYRKMFVWIFRGLLKFLKVSGTPALHKELLRRFPRIALLNLWLNAKAVQLLSFVSYVYSNYVDYNNKTSTVAQSLPALATYSTLLGILCASTGVISRGYGPKNGMKNSNLRFVFHLFFAIRCSLKVFLLFGIELVGFPVLAGLMIDFSLIAPCLTSHDKFLLIGGFDIWSPAKWVIYWVIGTFYMCWFAKYVAMIRKYIIRPGVLFFIRSSDDPNIRILHDSLIHPMRVQISRLLLSIMLYALFIVIGFGFHTRILFPMILKSKLLPFKTAEEELFFYWIAVTLHQPIRITEANKSFNLYVRQYWTKAFDLSCKKLRLSSFILNKDVSTERGYIVYRNPFYRFFLPEKAKWSNPDLYVDPKTPTQADELFKANANIHAYFVPDGTLMRVPANDLISRNYVQTLFVPVTKENKLLKPLDVESIKERNKENAGDYSHLDDQSTEFDAYTVVYTPPNFRSRFSTLLLLIWIFASVLCITLAFFFNLVGRITLVAVLSPFSGSGKARGHLMMYRDLSSVSLWPISIGAWITMRAVDLYHKFKMTRVVHDEYAVHPEPHDEAEVDGGAIVEPDNHDAAVGFDENEEEADRPAPRNRLQWQERLLFILLGKMQALKYCIVLYYNFAFVSLFVEIFILRVEKPWNIDTFYTSRSWAEVGTVMSGRLVTFGLFFSWLLLASFIDVRKSVQRMLHLGQDETLKSVKNLVIDLAKECALTAGLSFALQMAVCTYEYMSAGPPYHESVFSTFSYLRKVRPSLPSSTVPWTIPHKLFFVIPPTLSASFYLPRLFKSISDFIEKSVVNTKEQVYGRGKTLTNLSEASR